MKNILSKLILIVGFFFVLWYGLSQIDYMTIFKIEEKEEKLEKKLGDLVWKSIKNREVQLSDSLITAQVQSIVDRLCEANGIEVEKIKTHIIIKSEVNAFALPDDHLVLHSGLLDIVDYGEELAGVIAHELAHMEQNHVMKKMIKEIGIAVLMNLTAGSGVLGEIHKVLTSSAYDRSLESEADEEGFNFLIEADIDPSGLANFLYKVGLETDDYFTMMNWIATHPDPSQRSQEIVSLIEDLGDPEYEPVFTEEEWQMFQEKLDEAVGY